MTYRKKKPELRGQQKLDAMKALRGQHDQRIRCGLIELLYGTGGETKRFLEEEIRRLEAHLRWNDQQRDAQDRQIINRERAKAEKALWAAGQNEDGD